MVAQTVKSAMWKTRILSLGWEDPRRRKWQPTLVLLHGKSHGSRSLVGYSPWGCKELDTTEQLQVFRSRLDRNRNGQTGKGQKSCSHPDSAPISLANSNPGHHLSFWLTGYKFRLQYLKNVYDCLNYISHCVLLELIGLLQLSPTFKNKFHWEKNKKTIHNQFIASFSLFFIRSSATAVFY